MHPACQALPGGGGWVVLAPCAWYESGDGSLRVAAGFAARILGAKWLLCAEVAGGRGLCGPGCGDVLATPGEVGVGDHPDGEDAFVGAAIGEVPHHHF